MHSQNGRVRREPLSVLYVGALHGTSGQRARTLAEMEHRVIALPSGAPPHDSLRHQLQRLANLLRAPGNPLRPVLDAYGANRAIRLSLRARSYDVIWIDRGLAIRADTLRETRRASPSSFLVSYSLDDMSNPQHQSRRWLASVSLYDMHVTNKSYNVAELQAMGASRVLFVDNAYDPQIHCPLQLSAEERSRFGARIGFVGHYERERGEWILNLCEEGLEVCVHGPAWEGLRDRHPRLHVGARYLDGLDYSRAVNATDINLGFLRKGNRDLQTTRSIEIPACGSFMLAERTDEHLRLFQEGVEAEFFDGFPELLEKCRHYLAHSEARETIAAAGRRRCLASDYSYRGQLTGVLAAIREARAEA